jgi:transcriptional regulator with XRE-family HTH domain
MSLAQRVRDCRYSKGWGPDELANRAEISRTALYQIESGKTGLPRAGTLRRIAVALDVRMEDLLGHEIEAEPLHSGADRSQTSRTSKALGWVASEGGPLNLPPGSRFPGIAAADPEEPRFAMDHLLKGKVQNHEAIFLREGELMAKLHDLLHSPLGESVTRVVDELHGLLPRVRPSS